jgi:hypothetical protein
MLHKLMLFGVAVVLATCRAEVQAQTLPTTQPAPSLPAQVLAQMPTVHTESLAEMALTLPKDLPAPRTLVLMGFEFDHQKVMDEWVEKLNLRRDQLPWLQTHLIPRPWGLISGFVNSRKRPYFPDAYQRERVAPVYTDVTAFITQMGFSESRQQVLLAVVQPDGKVLLRAEGAFEATQAQALLAVLNNGL